MRSERNVEDCLLEATRGKGWPRLFHEYFEDKKMDALGLFDKASKSQSGNKGKPDFLGFDEKNNIIVVVEAKAEYNKHGNETGSITETAVGGAIHYAKHAWKASLQKNKKYNIITAAVTGNEAGDGLVITIYGICSLQEKEESPALKALTKWCSPTIPDYRDMVKSLYSWSNIPDATIMKKTDASNIAVMRVSSLLSMTFYNEHNRALNKVHWTAIRDSLSEERPSVLGVLIVAIVESETPLRDEYQSESNKYVTYVLVDGQHRLMAYRQATKPIQETSVVAVEILRVKSVEEALRFYEVHYEALPAIEQEKVPEKSKEWPVFLVNSLIEKMQEKWKRTSGPTLVSNKETKMPGVNISDRKKDIVAYLENHRGEYEGKSVEEIFALLEKNNRLFNPSLRGVKYLTKRNNQPYSEKIMQEANKQNFWLSFVSVNEWFEGPNSNK